MAKKRPSTKVNTLTCPVCKDEVYSKATHDMRGCSCNAIFVDGGFDYFRCGYKPELGKKVKSRIRYVSHSKQELYDDWNCGYDLLGFIKK